MDDLRKNLKVPVEKLTEREARRTYEDFVSDQEDEFIAFINYLNKYINELREQGIISPYLTFYARIKATNSAMKNHEKKALDDVFGLEFVCATDEEIEVIKQELDQMMTVHKQKEWNKDNGYRATHRSGSIKPELIKKLKHTTKAKRNKMKSDEYYPIIEIQYKTIKDAYEAVYGSASHEKYKNTKIKELQSLYNKGYLTVGEYIPSMWKSDLENDKMQEMSTAEVLKKMYPSLKLKEPEQEVVVEDER